MLTKPAKWKEKKTELSSSAVSVPAACSLQNESRWLLLHSPKPLRLTLDRNGRCTSWPPRAECPSCCRAANTAARTSCRFSWLIPEETAAQHSPKQEQKREQRQQVPHQHLIFWMAPKFHCIQLFYNSNRTTVSSPAPLGIPKKQLNHSSEKICAHRQIGHFEGFSFCTHNSAVGKRSHFSSASAAMYSFSFT